MSFFEFKNEIKEIQFGERKYKVKRPPIKAVQSVLEAYNKKEISDIEYTKKLLFAVFKETNPEIEWKDIEEIPWNLELTEESNNIFLVLGYIKKTEKLIDTQKTKSQTLT